VIVFKKGEKSESFPEEESFHARRR